MQDSCSGTSCRDRPGGVGVGPGLHGLDGGIQPVGCNGQKLSLDEIPAPQVDTVGVHIHQIPFGGGIHIYPGGLYHAGGIPGHRQGWHMDRPAAKLPVDVCQRIVLLEVEFQVAVPVEKDHIGILAQKRLECRRLLTAPDVVGVDPQGIAAAVIGPHMLKEEAPPVPIGFQRLPEPLQLRIREQLPGGAGGIAHKDEHILTVSDSVIQRLPGVGNDHILQIRHILPVMVSGAGIDRNGAVIVNDGLVGAALGLRSGVGQIAADADEIRTAIKEGQRPLKVGVGGAFPDVYIGEHPEGIQPTTGIRRCQRSEGYLTHPVPVAVVDPDTPGTGQSDVFGDEILVCHGITSSNWLIEGDDNLTELLVGDGSAGGVDDDRGIHRAISIPVC